MKDIRCGKDTHGILYQPCSQQGLASKQGSLLGCTQRANQFRSNFMAPMCLCNSSQILVFTKKTQSAVSPGAVPDWKLHLEKNSWLCFCAPVSSDFAPKDPGKYGENMALTEYVIWLRSFIKAVFVWRAFRCVACSCFSVKKRSWINWAYFTLLKLYMNTSINTGCGDFGVFLYVLLNCCF